MTDNSPSFQTVIFPSESLATSSKEIDISLRGVASFKNHDIYLVYYFATSSQPDCNLIYPNFTAFQMYSGGIPLISTNNTGKGEVDDSFMTSGFPLPLLGSRFSLGLPANSDVVNAASHYFSPPLLLAENVNLAPVITVTHERGTQNSLSSALTGDMLTDSLALTFMILPTV